MVRGRPNYRGFANISFLSVLVGTLLLFFNNCGVLVQPGLDNMDLASVGYRHTGAEVSCSTCHEAQRPAPNAGTIHGNGSDCVNCHKVNSWVNVAGFSHSPTPTTCINCHLDKRPSGAVGTSQFDHANGGTGDCVSCHASQAGNTWAGGSYSHTPMPTACNSCHSGNRPAVANYPDGTRATGHYTAKDCYACHMPKSTTITSFVFNHGNAANQAITFCLPCHLSRGQAEHGTRSSVSYTGDGTCYNCHRVRRSWSR